MIILHALTAMAQVQIRGRVTDERNHPVPYANIGILNTSVGTISNEDGTFSVSVPDTLLGEKLIFSALGFETVSHVVQGMTGTFHDIRLNEQPIQLEAVTVTPTNRKTLTVGLGSRVRTEGTQYYDSSSAGTAMALKVRSDAQPTYYPDLRPPLYARQVRLWIHQNNLKSFKVRVRLYDIDKTTGLPGNDLLNESVIITSRIKKGWVSADLSKYNIAIGSTQFFVVFEWIMDQPTRMEIARSFREYQKLHPDKVRADTLQAGEKQIEFLRWDGLNAGVWFGCTMANAVYLNNTECYYRKNSLASWTRSSSVMAARIEVSNKPAKRKLRIHDDVSVGTDSIHSPVQRKK
jgi:hypothetical protein